MAVEQLTWILIFLSGLTFLMLAAFIIIQLSQPKSSGVIPKLDQITQDNRLLLERFTEKNGELKLYVSNTIAEQQRKSNEDLVLFQEKVSKSIEDQLEKINRRVDEKLGAGFDQTNKTFHDVVERLSKIDAAQKQIEKLSTDVVSLNDVLNDKKTRGTFGEVQLKQLFVAVFGENKPSIYELQKKLDNNTLVDAILHAPDPMGDLCIDSKFPLENYRRMMDKNLSDIERSEADKLFVNDVKKHIDSIASKYIIPNVTATQAVMFIPAEAIFADITSRQDDLWLYGQQKNVWMASPTTLMSILTIVQVVLRDIERNKYSKQIQEHLTNLSSDFDRYKERWDRLLKNLDTVSKTAKEVNISSSKITKEFKKISNVEAIDDTDDIELIETREENE
jgi:DNA recombination protein RmuC